MSFNESFFNLAPRDDPESNAQSEITFVTIIIAIIIAWTLVAFWTRFLENLAFGTLNLNGNSSWHSFIVAIVITIFFFAFIWMIDRYDIVPGGLEPEAESIGGEFFGENIGQTSLDDSDGTFIPSSISALPLA